MVSPSRENFLEEILLRRRAQVAKERTNAAATWLRKEAERVRANVSAGRLRAALRENAGVNIIGEFKRASPSLGVIRPDASPAVIARLYEETGACAISVLTEPDFFRGSMQDLREARIASTVPILRKDFIFDEYQIDEAAAAGADAILLIVAALADTEINRLRQRAEHDLGLDALIEVHSAEEMRRATDCGATLIGVNNRDLRTFVTALETSLDLAPLAPVGATLVSESGISSSADIARLMRCGYHGFLIGESLMRADDPAALMRSLRGANIDHA